jgi:CRP-like cAMP-binding protein
MSSTDDISNENEAEDLHLKNEMSFKEDRLNIPTLKYFWQASPLAGSNNNSIPKFLRSIKVLAQFTDYELKIFSGFIHQRKFSNEEIILKEGDTGFGFYLILNGQIEIYTQRNRMIENEVESYQQFIARLSKSDYFGELSLLEQQNKRNATAISKGNSNLLAIYKPDLEEMIDRYPIVGAKFLQSIALIVAMRFNRVTDELKIVKEKVMDLERKLDSQEN